MCELNDITHISVISNKYSAIVVRENVFAMAVIHIVQSNIGVMESNVAWFTTFSLFVFGHPLFDMQLGIRFAGGGAVSRVSTLVSYSGTNYSTNYSDL